MIDKRKSELIDLRHSKVIGYRTFIKEYPKYPDYLFAFFEGKDDRKYYNWRIKEYYKREYIPFECGNKAEVLKTYKAITEKQQYEYCDAKVYYFIDKDFGESENNVDIFQTDCYSIENYYTTEEVFKEILKSEFCINITDDYFNLLLNIYRNRQKEFHNAVKLLNCWIACIRDKEKMARIEGKEVKRLKLDRIEIKRMVKVGLDKVTYEYNINDIKQLYPDTFEVSEKELAEKETILLTNPQVKFRGKYEIYFFEKFIEKLKNEFNSNELEKYRERKDENFIKRKVNLNVSGNILSALSCYAETPETLKEYLKRYA